MNTTSLPTQDYDSSDSGLSEEGSELVSYVIRITPCDKFTFQQVVEYIRDEPFYLNYVVSRELVPREHFHIVVQTDSSFTIEDVRGSIRAFIIPFWQDDKFKLPRGFGNKQYNLQLAEDLDRAVSYAVKLGEFSFEGFSQEYINERLAESFEKKSPATLRVSILNYPIGSRIPIWTSVSL